MPEGHRDTAAQREIRRVTKKITVEIAKNRHAKSLGNELKCLSRDQPAISIPGAILTGSRDRNVGWNYDEIRLNMEIRCMVLKLTDVGGEHR